MFLHIGDYKLVKLIGKGGGGSVYCAKHTTSQKKAAIKICPKKNLSSTKLLRIRKEYTIMSQLTPHENVIKLYQVIESDNFIAIVMEYAEGGDLFQYIKDQGGALEVDDVWRVFRQLVRALMFVHSNGFVHRDLKPENVFLSKGHTTVMLGDFGFADIWNSYEAKHESVGSLNYCSPELLNGGGYVGPEVDMWSLGACLFAMLTGQLPFAADRPRDVRANITAANWSLNVPWCDPRAREDPSLIDLLGRLLNPKPLRRAQILDVLLHPWYRYGPPLLPSSRNRSISEPTAPLLPPSLFQIFPIPTPPQPLSLTLRYAPQPSCHHSHSQHLCQSEHAHNQQHMVA